MAIVPNKDGQGIRAAPPAFDVESTLPSDIDGSHEMPTMFGTVSPFVGSVMPQYVNQIYLNTTTGIKYRCVSYWDGIWYELGEL